MRGVNWLGDAVMSLPALARLRERFPGSYICLLTQEKLAGLWERSTVVNSVVTFRAPESPFSVARRLKQIGAGIGLVLPNSPRSALELWLARIPERIGYAKPWRTWLLTRTIPARPSATRKRSLAEISRLIEAPGRKAERPLETSRHQIHEYLDLMAAAFGTNPAPLSPEIEISEKEVSSTASKFDIPEAQDRPIFGLNPGAEYGPAKRWPLERFISVGTQLQRETRCRWLIFGGSGDAELAEKAELGLRSNLSASESSAPVFNLAGKTTLRELCALLKLCRFLLTNDTGPMHVAAAVGTPVVTPFGSTSPELTGPGLPGDTRHQLLRGTAPCSPCFRRECPIDFRCMTSISVESVVEAVARAKGGIHAGEHSTPTGPDKPNR